MLLPVRRRTRADDRVGRSRWSFVVASVLAVPAMLLQIRGVVEGDESRLVIAWGLNAALYVPEQLTGALFLAIMIARLAGVYPPRRAR